MKLTSILKVSDDVRLGPWDRNGQHVALGGPELDDVAAVVLKCAGVWLGRLAGIRCARHLDAAEYREEKA
jgi:hypothetical protein